MPPSRLSGRSSRTLSLSVMSELSVAACSSKEGQSRTTHSPWRDRPCCEKARNHVNRESFPRSRNWPTAMAPNCWSAPGNSCHLGKMLALAISNGVSTKFNNLKIRQRRLELFVALASRLLILEPACMAQSLRKREPYQDRTFIASVFHMSSWFAKGAAATWPPQIWAVSRTVARRRAPTPCAMR